MNERLYQVLRAPIVSEKTARLQESDQYVFEVASTATKADVKAAVEKLFNVQVRGVSVVNLKGKTKAFRQRPGTRSNKRKAYVRLGEGQVIDVMAKA
ncbi:MAG: 50S ribosomal protein L23 [Dokdonella sp.]